MARVCAILVVEDDGDLGALMRDLLDIEGYSVTWATDYAKAATALRTACFDAILLDTPGAPLTADHWGAMARLQALAGGTPVILFTAHHTEAIADHAAHGFAAAIRKPFQLDDLLAVINRTLPDDCDADSDAA